METRDKNKKERKKKKVTEEISKTEKDSEMTKEQFSDMAEAEKKKFLKETAEGLDKLNYTGTDLLTFKKVKDETNIIQDLDTTNKEAIEIISKVVREARETKEDSSKNDLSFEELTKSLDLGEETEKIKNAFDQVDGFIEVELGENKDFKIEDAKALYESAFKGDEANSWEEIESFINKTKQIEKNTPNLKHNRFHVIIAHKDRKVVGYEQFQTLITEDNKLIVFGHYIVIADDKFMKSHYGKNENSKQRGIARVFIALAHKMALKDGKKMGIENLIGIIGESEMIGQADNKEDMLWTKKRLEVHNKNGFKVIMLENEDGSLVSPHMQPRLRKDLEPIELLLLHRPVNYNQKNISQTEDMELDTAKSIILSYANNFDVEGVDKNDVEEARKIMLEKFSKAKRVVLVPPDKLPTMTELAKNDPILKEQIVKTYGSLENQDNLIKETFANKE